MERRGLKSRFSNKIMGEPDFFISFNMTRSGSPNINHNYLISLRAERDQHVNGLKPSFVSIGLGHPTRNSAKVFETEAKKHNSKCLAKGYIRLASRFNPGTEMLASFLALFVFTLAFIPRKEKLNSRIWVLIIVPAIMLSLLLAYVSVTSVWRPHQMQEDVFAKQNALGEYEGVFPWAKLSYPFYLNVFHSSGNQLVEDQSAGAVDGQVQFSMFIANLRVTAVNGTFWFSMVRGPTPLHYKLDFIFYDPEMFYVFLIVLFTIFNIIGALLGIVFAKTLRARVGR